MKENLGKLVFPTQKNLIPGLVKLRTLWDNKSSMESETYEKEKGFAYLEISGFLMMGEEVISDNDYQNKVQKEVSKANKMYIFILFLIGFYLDFPDSWLATADYADIITPSFAYLIFQVLTFIFGRKVLFIITRDQDKALIWTLIFLLTNTIFFYSIFGLSILELAHERDVISFH